MRRWGEIITYLFSTASSASIHFHDFWSNQISNHIFLCGGFFTPLLQRITVLSTSTGGINIELPACSFFYLPRLFTNRKSSSSIRASKRCGNSILMNRRTCQVLFTPLYITYRYDKHYFCLNILLYYIVS